MSKIKIYKFGGASVKDANGVKNVANILQKTNHNNILVVVSAMGKMTNAFESLVHAYINKKEVGKSITYINQYHFSIIKELGFSVEDTISLEIQIILHSITAFFIQNKIKDYNFIYDQIVSKAELLSTKIVSAYLTKISIQNTWLDVRDYIKTDSNYRGANVNWKATNKLINNIKTTNLHIVQGFIAQDSNNTTTTLGREGSDYTAAIFAHCLDAESMQIFKDVNGVYNADPNTFKNAKLLREISYKETIEMAFYGASVIHPKTLQPLKEKNIPLYVKSFIDPKLKGTKIGLNLALKPKTACYIVKNNQILLSISTKNFSFMMEKNISEIFHFISNYKIKVNVIQTSAISLSICLEDKYGNISTLLDSLKLNYQVNTLDNLTLLTIRHFNTKIIQSFEKNKNVQLKQINKQTVQLVY